MHVYILCTCAYANIFISKQKNKQEKKEFKLLEFKLPKKLILLQ